MEDTVIATHEAILEEAQSIFAQVEMGGENLDPSSPRDQVLVAGASFIIAATEAGLSPAAAFDLILRAAVARDEDDDDHYGW